MSNHTARARAGQDRATLYDEISDRIIAELEVGRVPWVQPWGTAAAKAPLAMPKNASTDRQYSGVNILILWGAAIERGFTGQNWLTFRQALCLGGHVREGERGTTVVYADRFVPTDERRRAAETGEEAQAIPFLKRFTVFNTDQCEELPDEIATAAPPPPQGLIEPTVEALIKASGIPFRIGGDRAFYAPAEDYVQVPPPQAYFEPINWHRTALHELGHATGHRSRLNRDQGGSYGTRKYAFEELVAELSAAFSCASLGIVPTVRHADYIGSWLEALREDNRAIVRAASQASKAADYLLGFVPGSCGRGRVRGGDAIRDGLEAERESHGYPSWRAKMTKAVQKITLSPSRDIPFNKFVLSQSNVRRVKAGVSIEQLAESIAQRTLLQSLSVRAVVDADGNETGMFEVPAGGRRYRALELLVKQKRMSKTQAVPCVVREGGIAEDDSVAENDERVGLHPLDQFRAFQTLRDLGMTEEDIAARHFVNPAIVKQRLRLASVSPKLHEVYAEDGMTLEQLMAFSVTADHARQDQVWENVSRSGYDEPYLRYATMAEYFPKELAGRANAALNVFHIGGAFVVQYMTGLLVQLWAPTNGHYPEIAYQTAFAFNVGLQIVAGVWFALTWILTRRGELNELDAFSLKPLHAFELWVGGLSWRIARARDKRTAPPKV
jgi:ParB/RepB/Spo0J family partition protein